MKAPEFYDPEMIGSIYLPRLAQVREEALSLKGVQPASGDNPGDKAALLLVDAQIDFCNPKGSLYVPRAEKDIANSIRFIFGNFEKITAIYPTLDTHLAFQIFYPVWWLDRSGGHPEPFTIITSSDITNGKYEPALLKEWSVEYVRNLETSSRKPLCIWPEHTMIGTPGHALVPALYEVCFFHSIARKYQTGFQVKGDLPESEMYGVFSPEVQVPGEVKGGINKDLLDLLGTYDKIIVMGEAKSHCVLESVKQLALYFREKPRMLDKVYVLEDCMSPVRHPTIDFEAIAEEEFANLGKLGIHFAKSTRLVL